MKARILAAGAITVAMLAVLAAAVVGPGPGASTASSHREAPLISEDPVADNTDVYAFVSPDRRDTVTIVANYIPLEEPAGGPNFHAFGEGVLYELKVDNTGDGVEDISYQFRFRTETRNPDTFLYNTGPIETISDTDWNRPQFYSVTRVEGGKKKGTVLAENLPTPPVNIGPRSTPNYGSLMAAAVRDLPGGGKVYAGQTDDPFFVDLGSVFDLAGLRPFNGLHDIALPVEPGVDGVGGFNTHAIAIQIPIAQLTKDRAVPTGPNDPDAVIGVYATASRQRVQIRQKDGSTKSEGHFVQVSRLANPLINEVVIPIPRKDAWNASDPSGDAAFVDEYLAPEVTRLENGLYNALDDAPETGRDDLVAILLTGVDLRAVGGPINLNNTGSTLADLIRLNTGIAPTVAAGAGNRLGVLAGDFAGFPNGRRLEDDVTDIELRAFACGYGTVVGPVVAALGECGGNANRSPNNLLGDGVDVNDRPFHVNFPYAGEPHQGYEHVHHSTVGGP
ncbi:MAG: DUF4331 domain-containing protein [Gaiellaceae bacterium]